MANARRKTENHFLPATLAMTTPAVRMVVVYAWSYEDGDGPEEQHEVYPVLALTARQQYQYARYRNPGRDFSAAPTHEGMENLGWHYQSTGAYTHFDAVICTEDYGVTDAEFGLDSVNSAHEIVVCPWPQEEDEIRLATVVEIVRQRARELARIYKEHCRKQTSGDGV